MSDPTPILVKRFIDPDLVKKDLNFSLVDLSNAFVDQASMSNHYGTLHARATRQLDDMKLALEIAEAKVYRMLRDEAASLGEKRTEAQLEKAVAVHPRIIVIKKAINEAKQVEAQAKTAYESFKQRKDMLIQSGLREREEMKGELSLNARAERDAAAETERKALSKKIADAIARPT